MEENIPACIEKAFKKPINTVILQPLTTKQHGWKMILRNNFHAHARVINEEECTIREREGKGTHWHCSSVTEDPLELELQNRIS